MKASSCGLETYIKELTKKQITDLPKKSITGDLNFREVMSDEKNKIPFELKYEKRQREDAKCKVIPECSYFGNAERLIFTINKEYYNLLLEEGVAEGARFSIAGKLYLYSEDKSSFLSRL